MYVINTALRYVFSKEKGIRKTSVYIMLGISLSLMSFLVILTLMASLRDGNLSRIRDIESYDLVIENPSLSPDEIEDIEGVEKAFYFKDYNVVFSKNASAYSVAQNADFESGRVRAMDIGVYSDIDGIYFSDFERFYADTGEDTSTFIPSYSLAASLFSFSNEYTEVLFFKEGRTRLLTPFYVKFKSASRYRSAYFDFDAKTAFISLDDARSLLNEKDFNIGLYVSGGYKNAKDVSKRIAKADPACKITTFIQANSTLYSALMLENRMVYIFLLLISLVVLLQLKSGTRRIIEIKRKDAGILRVLGLEKKHVSLVFILYGLILLFISECVSIVLSMVICKNIHSIFSAFDALFGLFGRNLFLSSLAFTMEYSMKSMLATSFAVMAFGVVFILFGCKRTFKEDVIKVVLDVSY